jgi:hypothetical protein
MEEEETAKIAVIGFGSLIWSQGELLLSSEWQRDGPSLPIEFARVSQDGRLTLVIVPGFLPQKTLWALSGCKTMTDAKENLRKREGTKS